MTDVSELKRGDIVSFDLVRTGIVSSFSSVTVETADVGYDLAVLVDSSINEKHYNLYPYFKDKVNNVNDPSSYSYLVLKVNELTNALVAIGTPWIQDSTLKSSATKDITLILPKFQQGKRSSLETFLKNADIPYIVKE